MDVTTFLVWAFIIGLIYLGWHWRKQGRSVQDLTRSIQRTLREGIGAAEREEVKAIQGHLQQVQNQFDTRLAALEAHQDPVLPPTRTAGDLVMSVPSGAVNNAGSGSSHPPLTTPVHSIVWQGLRFTLSEAVWAYAGKTNSVDLTDEQLAVMIQGPFCPQCLKRWVGRGVAPGSTMPLQCRFCGIPWNPSDSYSCPVQVSDVKRLVYDHLDKEVRNQSSVLPTDNPS